MVREHFRVWHMVMNDRGRDRWMVGHDLWWGSPSPAEPAEAAAGSDTAPDVTA